MKKLCMLLFLMSFSLFAMDCDKNPIYCHIMDNYEVAKKHGLIRKSFKPDKKHAMKVSNLIYKMHIKYRIPKRIFTAILAQESLYTLKAKNCHSGLRPETDEEVRMRCLENVVDGYVINLPSILKSICNLEPRMIASKNCADFGISQIYHKTANRYSFDLKLLTTDLEYSVEAGAIVLKDFMKKYKYKEDNWWSRYNTSNKTKRKFYESMVNRFR